MMADWNDIGADIPAERDPRFDRPPIDASRERRAHARAFRYWHALRGRARMPDIARVDPAELSSFAGNSVLFELGGSGESPAIRFIGAALAREADADTDTPQTIVPMAGTILGELANRVPLIATTGAPLDFEAEFLGRTGAPTCYRGVLLPFADNSGRPAFIYGVITWKMVETATPGEELRAAIGSVAALAPLTPPVAPICPWDLPQNAEPRLALPQSFGQRLAAAQTWAALAAADHAHRAISLHAALAAAYDFLIAQEAAIGTGPDEAEIAAVLTLVFGPTLDDRARGRHRAVLAHAIDLRIGSGGLAAFLDRHVDGIDGFLGAQPPAPAAWPDVPYLTLSAVEDAMLGTHADPVLAAGDTIALAG